MAAIVQVVLNFLGDIFGWLVAYVTKSAAAKVTAYAAAAALIGAAYAGFHVAYIAAINSISATAPTGYMWDWAFSCMPSNTASCLSAISTIAAARWVYENTKALVVLSAQVKS